jgi:hypothetical protein
VADVKGQVVKLIVINNGHPQSSKRTAGRLPKQVHPVRPAALKLV